MGQENNGDGFWNSISGIATRIADLSHSFTWSSLGEAIKGIFGSEPSARQVVWRTAGDGKVCDLCADLEDTVYTEHDPMLPDMPLHVLCRCFLDFGDEE